MKISFVAKHLPIEVVSDLRCIATICNQFVGENATPEVFDRKTFTWRYKRAMDFLSPERPVRAKAARGRDSGPSLISLFVAWYRLLIKEYDRLSRRRWAGRCLWQSQCLGHH